MSVPSDLTPDLLEIAASLTIDDAPPKLRCGSCNLLAIDAFRMPCCDQIICGNCQQNLGQACPICLHEPVDAQDCKPNRALRTTVKVWLKKRAAEREAASRRELASRAPVTPVTPASAVFEGSIGQEATETTKISPADTVENKVDESLRSREASETQPASEVIAKVEEERGVSEAQKDIPQQSIETGDRGFEATADGPVNGDNTHEQESVGQGNQQQSAELDDQQKQQKQLYDQWAAANGSVMGLSNGALGFDGMNGGFPNMGFNSPADLNQMMQFMPTGMQNNLMGTFPNMMSMPGMGFDPMTMAQGMYGGYNGQGMGMNGMNAGMGFANGQGVYGGYNGQTASWNAGQNNYNQNAYGGHANGMAGDFGSISGYGGYNVPHQQGNFNQVHPRQFPNNEFQHGYHGQGFQNRGRGRGRGYQNAGRGRGGYNQVNSGYQANYESSHHQLSAQVDRTGLDQQQISDQPQHDKGLQSQQENGNASNIDVEVQKVTDEFDMAKELLPGDAEDHAVSSANPKDAEQDAEPPNQTGEISQQDEIEANLQTEIEGEVSTEAPTVDTDEAPKTSPIETLVTSEPAVPEVSDAISPIVSAPTSAMLPPPSPAIPTGPAAHHAPDQSQGFEFGIRGRGRGYHRGSFDYRGGARGRGSNHLTNGHSTHVPNGLIHPAPPAPPVAPAEPKGLGVEGAPKGPKALREGLPNTGIRGGRGFAIVGRASAVAHARSNGHAKSKSPSPTRSRSRSRSPHRSHHHRSYRHRSIDSSHTHDRDESRERHRRRSRKYADEDNTDDQETKVAESTSKRSSRRHRDDDKGKESARSSHRSHRSHRDRSYERDGEHRSSRRRSKSPETVTDQAHHVNGSIPTSPKAHKRKERDNEPPLSSRKRRERDEEDPHRERKRPKPDSSELVADGDGKHRSKRSHRDETDTHQNEKAQRAQAKVTTDPNKAPKVAQPQLDAHTREREARNAERLQKEMQRRQKQLHETESKAAGPKRRDSRVSQKDRRVSYKYEDEESNEARASRVESEREASRWG